MTKALMFPGQGAQKAGMALDIYQEYPTLLDSLNDALDFDLIAMLSNDECLGQTEYTQPVIVAHSTAIINELNMDFDYTVGHSLGEYAALVASGVLSAVDAIKIVRKRGQLMSAAFPAGVGSMAAVLGLSADAVAQICQRISTEEAFIEPANLNCPGQIVVSGHASKIKEFVKNGKSLGAKRVMELKVSGPFHSSLMKTIEEEFSTYLDTMTFNEARVPVIQNTTARPETNPDVIKAQLVKQLYTPVRFEESILYLISQGVTEFVEIGPSKVLNGLVKKINKEVTIKNIETLDDLKGAQV